LVKPPPYAWLVAALSLPVLAFVSYLDATCFFENGYALRWLTAGYYLVLVGYLLRDRACR
jgi:hypothetical protein